MKTKAKSKHKGKANAYYLLKGTACLGEGSTQQRLGLCDPFTGVGFTSLITLCAHVFPLYDLQQLLIALRRRGTCSGT